jgi:hypothetical protein
VIPGSPQGPLNMPKNWKMGEIGKYKNIAEKNDMV